MYLLVFVVVIVIVVIVVAVFDHSFMSSVSPQSCGAHACITGA